MGDPLYDPRLDADHDGLACETPGASIPKQAVLTCQMLNTAIDKSSPLYRDYLDGDHDGTACEAWAGGSEPLNCSMFSTPLDKSNKFYRDYLDRDNDGTACEWAGRQSSGQGSVTAGYTGDGPNCTEIGRTNIPIGDPQYAPKLDRDNDGIGCESGDGTYGLPATGR